MHRLAIVTSHPIQYHSPWFRALARATDLEVFYCHQQDAAGQADAGFGVPFEWDVPLLGGYDHTFLENRSRRPGVFAFNGCDTPEIGRRLRAGRFDACLITGWYLKSYLQALNACRRFGIPAVSRGDSQLATNRPRLWSFAKYVPYRILLNRYAAHLFVGQANREYLEHYGVPPERLFFTPHFVDSGFFAERAFEARQSGRRRALRRSMGMAESDFVLVFVGKLIEKKRPADFVRAIAAARQSGAPVRGLVVGSGPLDTETRHLANSLEAPVSFAGFQNQSALPDYLASADALVLPSDGGETWGLVVNEAMACGLPTIVSSAAGCGRDLIDEGRTGYRFPVGDIDRLAAAIVAVVDLVHNNRGAVWQAVADKIARYSCSSAVAGTLAALDAVTRAHRRADN
jgi:glycosyltransferase involved in cell wall biosynthesis